MEVEEEAGMYDDDVVVTQDIVDRVKEQAIIISDSPEKHRIRRPPATYTYTEVTAICSFHHRPEENALSLSTLGSNGTAFR